MSNFLFTTIHAFGVNQRVAINTDFIVKIADIGYERTLITLDDDSQEVVHEDFESVTAKLPNQPPKMIVDFPSDTILVEACTFRQYAQKIPPPPRKIQDGGGRWIKNPAFENWNRTRLAAKP
jgi:hypothetical protein